MNIPIKKNDYYEGTVTGLTHEGLGVVKIDNFPIFIKHALPDEVVKFKVVLLKKNFAFGKLIEIINKSKYRVEPKCDIYDQCGGCNIQHYDYNEQLKYKTEQVKQTLKRIGKIDTTVYDTIGMVDPNRYRNKTQVPFQKTGDNTIIAGFYKERSHDIIDMKKCLIQDELADKILNDLKVKFNELDVEPYVEEKHTGNLRHVVIRKGFKTNEYMVTFVTRENSFKGQRQLVEYLVDKYQEIKSIAINTNSKKTNVIFGDKTKVIYGEPYIYDYLGDIKFAISPRSFFQVNPVQTEILYNKAIEFANISKDDVVIDAYCGIGAIGLFAAKKAKEVYGVETIEAAVSDAILNAEINDLTNTLFEVGKAEEVIPNWYEKGIKATNIIVDPPRKGCDQTLLDTIIKHKIPRVTYVSCNPATLARDLRILEDGGYKTIEVQPVDMFPHTTHVETVVLIERM